ncbi:atypical chemokine receptor 3-like [Cyprinodon tularosa]|uniref:atypical chemokine receptor 3-like n=1 Tax=Cyprinodon tularosa TaxID=77115 RepID=UPI0018E28452|nr:atypical chemokine receptor 3-like [Cyprinodon tularosa]
MSLGGTDLSELLVLWEELNQTSNQSQVELVVCSGAVGHAALLHVLSVFYIFIFLAGLASNVLMIWVSLRRGGARSESRPYLLNLAAADLCVVLTLPFWVASLLQCGLWPFGAALCKATHLVFGAGLLSSILFLACLGVDAYLSVTLLAGAPSGRSRKLMRRLSCALLWLLALAASIPEAYFLQAVRSPHRGGAVCRPVFPSENPRDGMVGVQVSFLVLGFVVPAPIITVSYLLLAAGLPPGSDQTRRLIRSYVVALAACWLPFHTVLLLDTLALLDALSFSCRLESFLLAALPLTQCCSLLHCVLNPVLYCFLHRSRRHDLMEAFVFQYSTRTGRSDPLCRTALEQIYEPRSFWTFWF